jgi:chaperone BCS1
MIDYLRSLLAENQFLSGGLILGLLGTLFVLIRQYALKGVAALWRQCMISVEVRSTDAPFEWLVHWLAQQPYTYRARRLTVSTRDGSKDEVAPKTVGENDEPERPKVVFSPAPGFHIFIHRRRLIWLNRDRQAASRDNWRERETFNLTMLGRSQKTLRHLLDEAYDSYALTVRRQARVFLSVYSYWAPQGFVRSRSLDSVILPNGQKEKMVADLRTFLDSETWYHEMGIPYRRGYLLTGVPGSGKSSLVAAVAGAVGMHLYVVNLPGLGDSGLQELLQNVSTTRSIVLFEDIDVARAAQHRDKTDGKGGDHEVSVSGLLNALDGVASRDGYVTIMTTNRREMLDAALTRPGRIDMELTFGYATIEQALALYERFYGAEDLASQEPVLRREMPTDTSMATLQEHFLRHREDSAAGAQLSRLLGETRGLKMVER